MTRRHPREGKTLSDQKASQRRGNKLCPEGIPRGENNLWPEGIPEKGKHSVTRRHPREGKTLSDQKASQRRENTQ